MVDDLKIYINGQIFSKWESVEIMKDMEAVAGAYKVTLPIVSLYHFIAGSEIEIRIANVPVIKGYIETPFFSIEDNKYEFSISGRDKTGDLIDCSAVTSSSEFLNLSYQTFCEKLCEPFGISVIAKSPKAKTKITKITLQQGSVFDELEREARKIGVFLHPDNNGDLVIDEVGSETLNTRLIMPGNILKVQGSLDMSDRHSLYIVKGQQSSGSGGGVLTPKQQTQVSAKCTDENVTRYRPLIIIGESNINTSQAQARCEWEASMRAGKSEEIKINLDGWTDIDAQIWSINKLVSVEITDPEANFQFKEQLLIKSVSLHYNETDGQATQLTLTYPDAFDPKPVIPKKTGKNKTRILPIK